MKHSVISLMVTLFVALPANAQGGYAGWHRGWLRPGDRLNGAGFRGQFGGRGGWGERARWTASTAYGGANPAAVAQFDMRANQMRTEIAARASARIISPGQAYRMNQELNSLMATRAQLTAGGGVVDSAAVTNLNARLMQLQMGLRSPISF